MVGKGGKGRLSRHRQGKLEKIERDCVFTPEEGRALPLAEKEEKKDFDTIGRRGKRGTGAVSFLGRGRREGDTRTTGDTVRGGVSCPNESGSIAVIP